MGSDALGFGIGNAISAGLDQWNSSLDRKFKQTHEQNQVDEAKRKEALQQMLELVREQGAERRQTLTQQGENTRQLSSQDFQRQQTDAAQKVEKGKFVLKARNDRPLGAPVTRPEMDEETGLGNPSAFYDVKPEHDAVDPDFAGPLPEGETRDAQPERISFKGSQEAGRKQEEQDRKNEATQGTINAGYEKLTQAAEHLRQQGELNASNILLKQAQAELAGAKATGADKPKPLTLSQGGKTARTAIETAGPLTDQVIDMIRKQAPDIDTNPQKYNTVSNKFGNYMKVAKYKMGIYDDTDPRQQLVSLLQPIQAGQYTRSSRSRQMLDLALKHMADPSQTLLTQYQRAKELKGIMPEMLDGIIRAEQPVDPSNPRAGSYFDPARPAAGGGRGGVPGGGAPAAGDVDPSDPLGIRPKKQP